MRVAVFGDVHGNLPALQIFLSKIKGVDLSVNLGDTVNYGPWSNECAEILFELKNNINLIGNHDKAFIDKHYDGENEIAKMFFFHCIKSFDKPELIKSYSDGMLLNGTWFCHTIEGQYVYPDSQVSLKRQTVIGHSHRQFITHHNGFDLINPGSVGQNRVDISIINYSVWDTMTNAFELFAIPYDIAPVISEMKAKNYPEKCIAYYLGKVKHG